VSRAVANATDLPKGYWPAEAVARVLDKTLASRFETDLSGLSPAEHRVVEELVAVGRILGDLYDDQRHHQALRARQELEELHEQLGRPARTADLLRLEYIFQGPIATTLENELVPFLPVDGFTDGKNVYPWAIGRDEIDPFLETHPDRRAAILGLHTIVRRTTPRALRRDLLALRRHPTLAVLHPGLETFLGQLAGDPSREAFYAIPYSLAWPVPLLEASSRLSTAALAIELDDPDLGAFLRQRARDLLTDDNEAGDAAWIRGDLERLDAVIGAYEVYDDDLFGAKTFFGASLLLRDDAATAVLRGEMTHLQEIEDALPYEGRQTIRTDIPVASVNVLAAFGAGRTTGAEILPNDAGLIRKYGRKILVRRNLYTHPARFERVAARWRAVIAPEHHADLTPEGGYQQVVWHEIGHYLGPDTDRRGRAFETALGPEAALIEELKAELLSQFAANWLRDAGIVGETDARGVAAGSIVAGLRPVRPLRSQPYPTLWLMQLNYFLERGLLVHEDDRIGIRHERHAEAVTAMLADVLDLQLEGSQQRAAAYIERYNTWDDHHETMARALREAERHRYMDDRYALLEL
jgi:hypothetical protein